MFTGLIDTNIQPIQYLLSQWRRQTHIRSSQSVSTWNYPPKTSSPLFPYTPPSHSFSCLTASVHHSKSSSSLPSLTHKAHNPGSHRFVIVDLLCVVDSNDRQRSWENFTEQVSVNYLTQYSEDEWIHVNIDMCNNNIASTGTNVFSCLDGPCQGLACVGEGLPSPRRTGWDWEVLQGRAGCGAQAYYRQDLWGRPQKEGCSITARVQEDLSEGLRWGKGQHSIIMVCMQCHWQNYEWFCLCIDDISVFVFLFLGIIKLSHISRSFPIGKPIESYILPEGFFMS